MNKYLKSLNEILKKQIPKRMREEIGEKIHAWFIKNLCKTSGEIAYETL